VFRSRKAFVLYHESGKCQEGIFTDCPLLDSILHCSSIFSNFVKIEGDLTELDYAQIGKHIAARRKELGLKQTEVCDKAGIHDKYLILAISIITQPVKNILFRIIIFILQQLCSISILANLYHFRTIFIIANSSKIAVAASYSPAL